MRVKSWVEFTQPDGRVLSFSPAGLLTENRMYPEASAQFIQSLVADSDLAADVPEPVRDYFDLGRHAFIRGFFSYELFAASWTMSTLAQEFALGERFMESIGRVGIFRHRQTGVIETNTFPRFGDFIRAMRKDGARSNRTWVCENAVAMTGSFGSLLGWAHKNEILKRWLDERWSNATDAVYSMLMTGEVSHVDPDTWQSWSQEQRDDWVHENARAVWERQQMDAIREMRNYLAHPDFALVITPISASRQIQAASVFISSLWPSSTRP